MTGWFPISFYYYCLFVFSPIPLSTLSAFATKIFLGPKGTAFLHSQTHSCAIPDNHSPPSPTLTPWTPRTEASCPSCLGNVLRWTGCPGRPVNKLWLCRKQPPKQCELKGVEIAYIGYCYFSSCNVYGNKSFLFYKSSTLFISLC